MEEAELQDVFPMEQVEVEEMRRRQARKEREEKARQEEGDGRDAHEEEKVRTEEEKSMWDRKADGVAIDPGGKRFYIC
jgi:hypothetical protein